MVKNELDNLKKVLLISMLLFVLFAGVIFEIGVFKTLVLSIAVLFLLSICVYIILLFLLELYRKNKFVMFIFILTSTLSFLSGETVLYVFLLSLLIAIFDVFDFRNFGKEVFPTFKQIYNNKIRRWLE